MYGKRFPEILAAVDSPEYCAAYTGNGNPFPDGAVSNWNSREISVFRGSPPLPDIIKDLGRANFIVSETLAKLLEGLVPAKVQFLPIRFQSCDGSIEVEGCSILVVLRCIALREAAKSADVYDIFKVPYPSDLRVTLPLRDAILKAGIEGVAFDDAEYFYTT